MRKSALQLLTSMLSNNPFAAKVCVGGWGGITETRFMLLIVG